MMQNQAGTNRVFSRTFFSNTKLLAQLASCIIMRHAATGHHYIWYELEQSGYPGSAILEGERDPQKLAKLRDGRCKHDEETIASSLEGHYRKEHLFSLKQAVEIYNFYQQQIFACDEAIESELASLDSKGNQVDIPAT